MKFEGGWHPIWLQWRARYDILVGASAEEGYFFVRKMNASVQVQLRDFLDEKLFTLEASSPCQIEDIGYRDHCFKQILTEAASHSLDNSLILIPVNDALFEVAMNLYCSIKRQSMHRQTMFLSFDYAVHAKFIERNIISYYNPRKIWGVSDYQPWHHGSFSKMMRQKPIIWQMLLDIGVNFWQFDADTVVIHDLNNVLNPDIDVHVSIDELDPLEDVVKQKPLPNIGIGMVHFRNTPGTRILINMIQETLKDIKWMEDQEAFNHIVVREMSGGSPTISLGNFEIPEKWKDFYREGQNSYKGIKPVIGFLDQMEFVSGHYFLSRSDNLLRQVYRSFRVVHANSKGDKEEALRPKGLWLLVRKNTVSMCPFGV